MTELEVRFGNPNRCATVLIDEPDFSVNVRSEYQSMDCIMEIGEWSFAHYAGK